MNEKTSCSTLRVAVKEEAQRTFSDWQGTFNEKIASAPGFVSLEIQADNSDPTQTHWQIIQRFNQSEDAERWRSSPPYKELLQKLNPLLKNKDAISEEAWNPSAQKGGVTEVILTQVQAGQEENFRRWMAKMHHVEAQFPGFRGVYVQAPRDAQIGQWITLLQFDSAAHLDHWLASEKRREILAESQSMVRGFDSHRVVSPYAGWFASLAKQGPLPPAWKQTMIVLLVLFPIVMLEILFLNPHLTSLNKSLATFIGNAISVALVSWPMTPIAISLLKWWLVPKEQDHRRIDLYGVALIGAIYLVSILIFWWAY